MVHVLIEKHIILVEIVMITKDYYSFVISCHQLTAPLRIKLAH